MYNMEAKVHTYWFLSFVLVIGLLMLVSVFPYDVLLLVANVRKVCKNFRLLVQTEDVL